MTRKSAPENYGLRALPSIDALLRTETAKALMPTLGPQHVALLVRNVTDALRREVQENRDGSAYSKAALLEEAERRITIAHLREVSRGLARVVNATGVILHTNLGRAPLSDAARRAIADEAARYCNLELDLATGDRGRRGALVEELITELTGAESALIVNNCAAAALLILSVLARDGETIVSRGELVEIGGDFRVPDVMASSGTTLIEVGTTNRTSISDYSKAISERTRLLMRVHTSNYRIVGFTRTPGLTELADLAHNAGLPLYEDAGSGALVDFSKYGITGEPVIAESVAAGVDVVSFSGDKLPGGPQAGLVAGRKEIVERLRAHPLYRALRADKLALAALQATFEAHRRGESFTEIPTLKMIAMTPDEIKTRSLALIDLLRKNHASKDLRLEVVSGESAIGGGSGPTSHPPTALISIRHKTLSADQIESRLRNSSPPVISRIAEDRVLLDLRTVAEDEESQLAKALESLG